MMFPLYELGKFLNFPTHFYDQRGRKQLCPQFAFTDAAGRKTLSCFFDNGVLLLWTLEGKEAPQILQLPWFPEKQITTMCFAPCGSWLICINDDNKVYNIPVLGLLRPELPQSDTWKSDDVTEIITLTWTGRTTHSCWLRRPVDDVLAAANETGLVTLVNLLKGEKMAGLDMGVPITYMSGMPSAENASNILVTTETCEHWKIAVNLSDTKNDPEKKSSIGALKNMARATMKKMPAWTHTVTDVAPGDSSVVRLAHFPTTTVLCKQFVRGRHVITCRDENKCILQVYDSNLQYSPLYEFRVPPDTANAVLTDRLIFVTSEKCPWKLTVIADQLAEAGQLGQTFNKRSILQEFQLDKSEHILGMWRAAQCQIYYDANHSSLQSHCDTALNISRKVTQTNSVAGSQNRVTLALEAMLAPETRTPPEECIVVTNKALYVGRPRVASEELFLSLILDDRDVDGAETLGIAMGLDVNALYRLAAGELLQRGEYSSASRLVTRAKFPAVERLQLSLQHGYVKESLATAQLLASPSQKQPDLGPSGHTQVADLAVLAFIYLLLQAAEGSMEREALSKDFRVFLLNNYALTKEAAISVMVKYDMEHLVEFALERDVTVEAIKLLIYEGNHRRPLVGALSCDRLPWLAEYRRDRAKEAADKKLDCLLQLFDGQDMVTMAEEEPEVCLRLLTFLEDNLSSLGEDRLRALCAVLDPSRHPLRNWIWSKCVKCARTMAESTNYDTANEEDEVSIQAVVGMFLSAVVHRHRMTEPLSIRRIFDISSTKDQEEKFSDGTLVEGESSSKRLSSRPCFLSCGQNYSVLLRGDSIYSWGSTAGGRLGRQDNALELESSPYLVEHVNNFRVPVFSITCGGEHSLALTAKGIVGWGSSRYGQLGTGQCGVTVTSPQPMVSLGDDVTVTSIHCGQFHSVLVTSDFRVFTCGWGVHGQLGHGNPDDCCKPRLVRSLETRRLVQAAAGYAHTLVLAETGEVFAFGCSNFGQLGCGDLEKSSSPVLVNGFSDAVQSIATKYFHNFALTRRGWLFQWGSSPVALRHKVALLRRARSHGQKTSGVPQDLHRTPRRVMTGMIKAKVAHICCGSTFSALLTVKGEVFTWGFNNDGQLGTGNKMEERTPCLMRRLDGIKVVSIATGPNFALAMDESGALYAWGNNDKGQLGVKPRYPIGRRKGKAQFILGRPITRVLADSNSILEPLTLDSGATMREIRSVRSYREDLARHSGAEEWTVEECPSETETIPDGFLPELTGANGKPTYDAHCIMYLLKRHPELCDVDLLLRQCDKLQLWDLCALLSWHLHQPDQAFRYHVLQLRHSELKDPDVTLDAMITVSEYYLTLLQTESNDCMTQTNSAETFTIALLRSWFELELPVVRLESLILDAADILAVPFFNALISLKTELSDGKSSDHKAAHRPMNHPWTNAFLFALTERCLGALDSPTVLGMLQQTTSLLSKNTAGSAAHKQQLTSPLKAADKLISKEKLLQDIAQHHQRGDLWRSESVILSRRQLTNLAGGAGLPLISSVASPTGRGRHTEAVLAYVFSCGHHCTGEELRAFNFTKLEAVLEAKQSQAGSMLASLKNLYMDGTTGASPVDASANSPRCLPMGCPACVVESLVS